MPEHKQKCLPTFFFLENITFFSITQVLYQLTLNSHKSVSDTNKHSIFSELIY